MAGWCDYSPKTRKECAMTACSNGNLVPLAAVVGFWLTMMGIPISIAIAIAWVKVARIRHQKSA
jgi:hypothetical protein